jgi:hypothetical protein
MSDQTIDHEDDEPRRGVGRPEHEPTPRNRTIVQVMHAHGIPYHIIAHSIGITANTLRKHYREDLRDARLKTEAAMGAVIVNAARSGVWGAAKYWLLCHGSPQWRASEHRTIDGNINLTDSTLDELERRRAELERLRIAGDRARDMEEALP